MNLEDLTIKEVKQLTSLINTSKVTPFKNGENYFIRTATYFVIGTIKEIIGDYIILKAGTVAWIADTGRFTQFINNGTIDKAEIEPVDTEVFVNINNIIDVYLWLHELLRKQK